LPPHRIVTLLPSATEIVCALGFEHLLVGRSHECDYPPSVTKLPALTAPTFNVEGTSAEIDERVRDIVTRALSVYRVDAAMLAELRPDVIVTQSQCDVCAVSMSEVEAAVSRWTGARPTIVSLAPYRLGDVWKDIETVAIALGTTERGVELAERLKERCAAIERRATALATRPSVACIEWIEPLMGAGNWMPELVEMAGAANVFGLTGERSPYIAFEDLVRRDPDIVMLAPCGFAVERTMKELAPLERKPEWRAMKAVREARVFVADGNQYFNRSGPRLVESLEILAEIVHPETFRFGHEASAWRRLYARADGPA
jgi:iron complex transport system substrate-binding protein